jgi:hypothetical protein
MRVSVLSAAIPVPLEPQATVAEMMPYGWRAKTLFGWIPVPGRIILHIPNPTGEAILCWTPNRGPIWFVPPPGAYIR